MKTRLVSSLTLVMLVSACATVTPAPVQSSGPVVGEEARPTPVAPVLKANPFNLAAPPLNVTVQRPKVSTLPNGLTVYLMEDHTAPLVSIRVLLPSGSVDDPVGSEGLAALLADVVETGGTASRSPEQLEELLEAQAANVSAGASDEFTTVSASIRASDVTRLMPVIAELVQKPGFNAARLEVSRGQFIDSVKRRNDRPDGVASRVLAKAIFGPQSLFARESSESSLKGLTVDALKKLHRERWGPAGSRLVVTGDFDAQVVNSLIALHWAGWSGAAPFKRTWPHTGKPERRVILVDRDIAQVKVRIGGFGYQRGSDDEFAARLVSTALGSFGVGRLYKEIRDERGLAYSAFASVSSGPTVGQFTAGCDTRPDQAALAIKATLELLTAAGSADAPITEGEKMIAQDLSLNTFAFRFDTAQKTAWERALLDAYGYPDDYLDTFREKISRVKTAGLDAMARRLGDASSLQIVIVGPVKKMGDLSGLGPAITITDPDQFR